MQKKKISGRKCNPGKLFFDFYQNVKNLSLLCSQKEGSMSEEKFKKETLEREAGFLPPLKRGVKTAFAISSLIAVILSMLPVIN